MDGSPTDSASELDSVRGWSLIDRHGDFEDDDSSSSGSSVEVVSEAQVPDLPVPVADHSPPMFVLRLSSHQDIADSDDEKVPSHPGTRESHSFDVLSTSDISSLQNNSPSSDDRHTTSPWASINSSHEPGSPMIGSPRASSLSGIGNVATERARLSSTSQDSVTSSLSMSQRISQEDLDQLVLAIDRVQSALPAATKGTVPVRPCGDSELLQDENSVSSLEMFGGGMDGPDAAVNEDKLGAHVEDMSQHPRANLAPEPAPQITPTPQLKTLENKPIMSDSLKKNLKEKMTTTHPWAEPSVVQMVLEICDYDEIRAKAFLETMSASKSKPDDLDLGGDLGMESLDSSISSMFSFLDRNQGLEVDQLRSPTSRVPKDTDISTDNELPGTCTAIEALSSGAANSALTTCNGDSGSDRRDAGLPTNKLCSAIFVWSAVFAVVAVVAIYMLAGVKGIFFHSHPLPGYIQQVKYDKLFDSLDDCKARNQDHKVKYEWQSKQLDICRHRTLAVLEEQLKDTIDNYENILQNYRGQLSNAMQENADLKSDSTTVHGQFNITQKENSELRAEITTWKNIVSGQEEILVRMERESKLYQETRQELLDMTTQMAVQNETIVRKTNTIQKYRVDLNQVRQENSDLRSEVMKLKYSDPHVNGSASKGPDATVEPVVIKNRDHCLLPPDSGPCEAAMFLWHYDPSQARCLQFIYGGCHGNKNRFKTKQECEDACVNKTATCADQLRDIEATLAEDRQKLDSAQGRANLWADLYTEELDKSCDQKGCGTVKQDREFEVSTCWQLLEGKFQERIKGLSQFWPNDAMTDMFNYFQLIFTQTTTSTSSSESSEPTPTDSERPETTDEDYNSAEESDTGEEADDTGFRCYVDEQEPETQSNSAEENKSEQTDTGNDENQSDFWSNILDKTKDSVSAVGDQLQSTWEKVKDVSGNMWEEHHPAIQKLQQSFSKKIHTLKEKFQEKLYRKTQKWFGRKRKYRWENADDRNQYHDGEDSSGDAENSREHSQFASSTRRNSDVPDDEHISDHDDEKSQDHHNNHHHGNHHRGNNHHGNHHHGNHHHGGSHDQELKRLKKCHNQFRKIKRHSEEMNMKKFRHLGMAERFEHNKKLQDFHKRFGAYLKQEPQMYLQCQMMWWQDASAGVELRVMTSSPWCPEMLDCWQLRLAGGDVDDCRRRKKKNRHILDENVCVAGAENVVYRHQMDDADVVTEDVERESLRATATKSEDPADQPVYRETADNKPSSPGGDADKRSDWLFARAEEREMQRGTPDDWYVRKMAERRQRHGGNDDDDDDDDYDNDDDDDDVFVEDEDMYPEGL